MQLVPEIKLSEFGCISKYLKEPSCPKEQQTWRWEASGEELGCLNWNCCGLITQILLHDYIAFCMEVNLIAVLLTMLAIMLFQIRQLEDHGTCSDYSSPCVVPQVGSSDFSSLHDPWRDRSRYDLQRSGRLPQHICSA